VLEAQMRALGAIPQVMAFSEVYQALATGVVDGTENTPSNEYTQKMHEVQKYTMLSDHGYIGYAVIANKRFWDGLPADIRAALTKAMNESTAFANEISQKDNDDALAEIKKSGKSELVALTAEQKAAWRKALDPVYSEMTSRVGKDVLSEFEQEVKSATN
jgi:C4-dicarboxylate-binding protein DctP